MSLTFLLNISLIAVLLSTLLESFSCIQMKDEFHNRYWDLSDPGPLKIEVPISSFDQTEEYIHLDVISKEEWVSSYYTGTESNYRSRMNFRSIAVFDEIAYVLGNKGLGMFDISDLKWVKLSNMQNIYKTEERNVLRLIGEEIWYGDTNRVRAESETISPWGFRPTIPKVLLDTRSVDLKKNTSLVYYADANGIGFFDYENQTYIQASLDTDQAVDLLLSDDGKFCYVADGTGGFKVVDIQDNSEWTVSGSIGIADCTRVVRDPNNVNFVFIADYGVGMKIVNVTDKVNPQVVGSFPCLAEDVFVKDEIAYIANGVSGVSIVNVADRSDPTFVSSIITHDARGIFVDEERVIFVADEDIPLTIINGTNITNPKLISYVYTISPFDVQVDEQYIYIADGEGGVKILEWKDHLHYPRGVGHLSWVDGFSAGIELDGEWELVYIADQGNNDLKIVDVSDRTSPMLLKTFNFGSHFEGEEVGDVKFWSKSAESRIILVTTNRNLFACNISQNVGTGPNITVLWNMTLSQDTDTERLSIFMKELEDFVFILDIGVGRIHIVDISSMELVNSLNVLYARSIDVSQDRKYLYVGTSTSLNVFDMEDLSNIYLLTAIFIPKFSGMGTCIPANGVYELDDSRLLFVTGILGIRVYNMEDPFNSYEVGSISVPHLGVTNGYGNYIRRWGNTFFITTSQLVSAGGTFVIVQFGSQNLEGYPFQSGNISCGNVTNLATLYPRYDHVSTDGMKIIVNVSFSDLCVSNSVDGNGVCDQWRNRCNCSRGYEGLDCSTWSCNQIPWEDYDQVCSVRGNCTKPNNCTCQEDFTGQDCQLWTCFGRSPLDQNVCGGHGTCSEMDKCNCDSGYSSLTEYGNCTEFFCGTFHYKDDENNICNGRGICISSQFCECSSSDYYGDLCEYYSCFLKRNDDASVCNGNGKCISPDACECFGNFVGKECDFNSVYYTIVAPAGSVVLFFGLCVLCTFAFLFFVLCCCFICCVCVSISIFLFYLCLTVCSQNQKILRFRELRNFDLLLKEQEMDLDDSVAHLRIEKSLFSVPFEEIDLLRVLGSGGSNSVVYEAKWQTNRVAFKCFKTRTVCSDQHSFDEFEREVQVMANLSHPHVIRFFGASLNPPRVGILMEFCEFGEVLHFFEKYCRDRGEICYPLEEKIRMIGEISSAFVYLHSRNVIHRDLKAENVLIDGSQHCKVMDFGLSKIVERMSVVKTSRVGTSWYMPPEVVLGGNYDQSCDVFSFGILMFVILTQKVNPYSDGAEGEEEFQHQIEFKVSSNPDFRPNVETIQNEVFKTMENRKKYSWLIGLMERCWVDQSKKRPDFERIAEILREKKVKEHEEVSHGGNDSVKGEIQKLRRKLEEKEKVFGDVVVDKDSIRKKKSELEDLKKRLIQYEMNEK